MNLLILVTAIFAIVGFFTLGLTDITEVNEAKELASRLKEKGFSLANSSNFCFSDQYDLPQEFFVAGRSYLYVLQISKTKLGQGDDESNALIFSIFPREEIKHSFRDSTYTAKAVAAESFRTNAEIFLYSWDYRYDASTDSLTYDGPQREEFNDKIYVDPQAIFQANKLELIREVKGGEPSLYIIACNAPNCAADKTTVGEEIHPPAPPTDEGGFRC